MSISSKQYKFLRKMDLYNNMIFVRGPRLKKFERNQKNNMPPPSKNEGEI
jgi:hypothetical protein